MSHLLFLFMCDLTLKKGRIKSSSYGLPIDMALLLRVWILARIYRKGKSLKQQEKIR